MATKASDHIKPCNIGQSEAHNKRTKEYMERIKKENVYIRTDLSHKNSSWTAPSAQNMSLQEYHDVLARLVKEKTGRAMQTKVRERLNKKTGRVMKVSGSSALRESVVNCKENTTMDDLQRYCRMCKERWGITAIQIHIHQDEGHWTDPERKDGWVPNLHAHIIWDWMDHSTGKSIKLAPKDMSEMQDMVAEALGMERGTRKAETGLQHLERNDFIIAKQKREMEELERKGDVLKRDTLEAQQEMREAVNKREEENNVTNILISENNRLKKENERLKGDVERLTDENESKRQQSEKLDKEISEKREKANKEHGNAILNKISSITGIGDYADLEKKYEKAQSENAKLSEDITALMAEIPNEKKKLKRQFNEEVAKKTKELLVPVNEKMAATKKEKEELEAKINAIFEQNKEKHRKKNEVIKSLEKDSEAYRNVIKWLLALYEKIESTLREAIKIIINFAKSPFSIFDAGDAQSLKRVIDKYSQTPEDRPKVANLLVDMAESQEEITGEQFQKAHKEVIDIAEGRYDRLIQRNGYGMGR